MLPKGTIPNPPAAPPSISHCNIREEPIRSLSTILRPDTGISMARFPSRNSPTGQLTTGNCTQGSREKLQDPAYQYPGTQKNGPSQFSRSLYPAVDPPDPPFRCGTSLAVRAYRAAFFFIFQQQPRLAPSLAAAFHISPPHLHEL